MKGLDVLLQGIKSVSLGLDREKPLPFVPDLSLPAIDGTYRRNEVHASSEVFLDQGMGDLERLFFGTGRDENHDKFGWLLRFHRIRTRLRSSGSGQILQICLEFLGPATNAKITEMTLLTPRRPLPRP